MMNSDSAWRYKLAKRIYQYTKRRIAGLRGFYVYGSTATGQARPTSDIDLLVIHEDKGRVKNVLEKLNSRLTRAANNQYQTRMSSLLNVRICSPSEVQAGAPCCTILQSLHQPPLALERHDRPAACPHSTRLS
jgi:predicted nucleotidyltransferase